MHRHGFPGELANIGLEEDQAVVEALFGYAYAGDVIGRCP
jgi:hypothetical protein